MSALHAMVARDYAQRWEGLEAPSLDDVEMFCAGARIVVTARDGTMEAHLAELDLVLRAPPET